MKSAVVRLGAVACLLGFATTAHAQTAGVSYTYVDAQYSFASIDVGSAGDVDADGPKLFGSVALNRYFHALVGFERLSPDAIQLDDGLGNITTINLDDLDTWEIGVGVNTPTMGRAARQYRGGFVDRYSLFADIRVQGQDSSGSDRTGWSVNSGFRAVNFTRLETILGVGYEKFESQSGDFTMQGQILFQIIGGLHARGGVNYSDSISRWNLGLRYNFGDWQLFGR